MKILLLDIETAPNTAFIWRLFKENIGLNQLIESSYVLCWCAKWYGESEVMFDSVYRSSPKRMLQRIHKLLDEADAVVHFNGNKFDIPTLNKEFLEYGMAPPSPAKQIDLYKVVRARFRFISNKLTYLAEKLRLGKKIDTSFKLWVDCMNNNPDAWAKMERYNKQDVRLLERLYKRLLPWIKQHANHSLYSEKSLVCPNCASTKWQRRGYTYTAAAKYQRYQCTGCRNWFRGGKSLAPTPNEKFVNIA